MIFIYHDIQSFSEGLAVVCLEYRWGFIDITGKLVLDYLYPTVTNFKNAVAEVYEIECTNDSDNRAMTFGSESIEYNSLYFINKT